MIHGEGMHFNINLVLIYLVFLLLNLLSLQRPFLSAATAANWPLKPDVVNIDIGKREAEERERQLREREEKERLRREREEKEKQREREKEREEKLKKVY